MGVKKNSGNRTNWTKNKRSKTTLHFAKIKNKKKEKPTEVHYHSTKEIKVEKALIDNFIGLQKVMVNLSSRFDELSNQISKLLNIFEVSAKAMAKKEFEREKDPEFKKIIDKLDNIGKQAGLIGKGLALIHEINKEQIFEIKPSAPLLRTPPKPMHPSGMQPSIMDSKKPMSQSQNLMPQESSESSSLKTMGFGENSNTQQ